MLTIKQRIAEKIVENVKKLNADAVLEVADVSAMLEYPPDTNMGDLAFPCFKLSKILRRSPVQIAQALVEGLEGDAVGCAEAVNGYLNIRIDKVLFQKTL